VRLALVWAQAQDGVIGREGGLPWHLPEDLARFRSLTRGGTVVMGRATWESLPERFRPLPGRRNLVLSRRAGFTAEGAEVFADLPSALAAARQVGDDDPDAGPGVDDVDRGVDVWVIGGAQVYAAALPLAQRLAVTEVDAVVAGDAHAPEIDRQWRRTGRDPQIGWHESTTGLRYRFVDYVRAATSSGG
jgi:dihydrofolate reductase